MERGNTMICFVILHYQAEQETVNCINNIKEKVQSAKKIVVVDNASPNGSGEYLQKRYDSDSEVEIVLLDKNLGFAKGNNWGFRVAKKYAPDFVVVMNNDVLLEQEDIVFRIERAYERNRFDVLGPDIFSTKANIHQNPQRIKNYTLHELVQTKRKLHFKNKYKFLLKLKYLLYKKETDKRKQNIDYTKEAYDVPLHGACYIFSKDFIKTHNNCFYNKTFMYYESYILHYLEKREGLSFVYCPDIKVLHHEDIATNQTYSKIYNKVIFVNKCLEESCQCFIDVMNDPDIKIG